MRQIFNYHTHTYRCGHARMVEDEEYVKAAIKAGFKVLGFSDHAPYPNISKKSDRMDYDEKQDYLNSIKSLKEKYKDQIDIKIGFEMEYLPVYDEYIKGLKKEVDYLLLGQHYNNEYATFDYAHHDSTKQEIIDYGNLVVKGIESKNFLYAAHPDYYCAGIYDFDDTSKEVAHKICNAAAINYIPLEINIKLLNRQKRIYKDGIERYVYPFRPFWEIAKEYPIKVVYGFDAHDPEILTSTKVYEISDEILKDLTFDMIKEPLI